MWMRIADVDLEPAQLRLSQRPVLQHASDCVTEWMRRMLDNHVTVRAFTQSARVAGIRRVDLGGRCLVSNKNALDVDDDHVIAGVQMRRVRWLVLDTEDFRNV